MSDRGVRDDVRHFIRDLESLRSSIGLRRGELQEEIDSLREKVRAKIYEAGEEEMRGEERNVEAINRLREESDELLKKGESMARVLALYEQVAERGRDVVSNMDNIDSLMDDIVREHLE